MKKWFISKEFYGKIRYIENDHNYEKIKFIALVKKDIQEIFVSKSLDQEKEKVEEKMVL